MLNGHTTFLMSKPEFRQGIKDHRMQWITNQYTNYENVDKRPYYEYYKNNVNDNYPGIFAPPPCFYNQMIRDERREAEQQQKENENDDIAQHYRELAAKYTYLASLASQQASTDTRVEKAAEDDFVPTENSYESSTADELEYQSTDYYDDTYDWDEYYDNECYEDDDYDY